MLILGFMLSDQIEQLKAEVRNFQPASLEELENFRIQYLGRKGAITQLMETFKNLPSEEKKIYGKEVNALKAEAQQLIKDHKDRLEEEALAKESAHTDLSLDPAPVPLGARHPISMVIQQINDAFNQIGFAISDGPELVDDWHNFTALNIPPHHPARDMQDTFFTSEDQSTMLRTHTSSVQVAVMQKQSPPIRTIAPGRTFRRDSDATHSPFFHQIEGLYVDENVSMTDLKQTLYYFVQQIFGEDIQVRFRPSYFPFTEPSAEMDIRWEGSGPEDWMEILGCGMVDPEVFRLCGIDEERYTGYAFGIGIERIAMLKYQIPDIRTFFENDVRFLSQFKSL
jgi:phenylalanyl-tRNA synthetase alpha chain